MLAITTKTREQENKKLMQGIAEYTSFTMEIRVSKGGF